MGIPGPGWGRGWQNHEQGLTGGDGVSHSTIKERVSKRKEEPVQGALEEGQRQRGQPWLHETRGLQSLWTPWPELTAQEDRYQSLTG